MAMLSVNEMTTYRWSFEEDVQNYRAAGFDAIGVWRQKLSDYGEEKGVELCTEAGLRVSSLLWAGGFTGSDGRSFKEGIEDAREAIRLAGQLKAGCLIVYSGARGGHTHNHARRLIKSALKELAPIAAESNVTLAVEPMHAGCAAEWTFYTDLGETLDLLEAVGNPNVKIAFDTYHLCQNGESLDSLAEIVSRIAVVQLGDAKRPPEGEQNRCRLGEGSVPLGDILSALSAAGYEGYYEIELMGEDIETSDYEDLLVDSKRALAQWMES